MSSTTISPGFKALGVECLYVSGGRNLIKRPNWNEINIPVNPTNIVLHLSNSYAMGCCGASTLSNLSGHVREEDKENVAMAIWKEMIAPCCTTWYGIASSHQLQFKGSLGSNFLGFLMELGLKEVFKSRNRNHGPNDLHIMVWDPVEVIEKKLFDKYLWHSTKYGTLPRSFENKSEESLQTIFSHWKELNEQEKAENVTKHEKRKELEHRQRIDDMRVLFIYDQRMLSSDNKKYLNDFLRLNGYERIPGFSSSDSTAPAPVERTQQDTVERGQINSY
jgi:hypothetical protein